MADDRFEREEQQEVGRSHKQPRCRFHETEVYQIFCKDCKDFMCFKCIGQLHQKHELSQLQDADEAIRTELCDLLLENKYAEHLSSLKDKVSDNEKELVQDEESLKRDIRTSVEEMKQNIDIAEKRLLSELRNEFESYQISLQEQKININSLQTKIANLDVNKLPEYNLNHVINNLSEMKLCSSSNEKLINLPKPGFQPTMEFSIGNLIQTTSGKPDACALLLPSSSNVSTQTDSKWNDAEDRVEDNAIESSSDEITDEYPIKFQMNQDIKLISKIVPISEKNAWIISNRKLLKIIDFSVNEDVYSENVDDIVVLKDGCVLVLRQLETFIMKLLPNRRLVRFADVGTMDYHPRCMCIRNDIVIIYLWCVTVNEKNVHTSKSHIIWMNTEGIVTKRLSFSERIWKQPSFIQSLESGVCVLYCENCTLYFIDLLDAKSDKCDKLYRFKGIYGLNPEKNFDCTGMCTDKFGNLLVSDHRHHSVYVLDKELKYIKTLFDARNGLDKPAAINIFNDQIWVSDGNQMYIFPYTNV